MPYDTKELLKDKRKVPIPQFYDPATDAFLPLTGVALGNGRYAADGLIWGKTAGGLYVPVKVADDGTLNAQLTGSSVTEAQALPTVQTKKDIAMRSYEKIIDVIGAENLVCLVPFWETSGDIFYDLLSPNSVQFRNYGGTLAQEGLLHDCVSLDGVNDYILEEPHIKQKAYDTFVNLDVGTKKIAQKIQDYSSFNMSSIQLCLKRIGTLSTATLKVEVCADNAGVPGSVLTTSNILNCADVYTASVERGFVLNTPHWTTKDARWLVLSYADATGVDASNYIAVAVNTAGGYAYPYAIFDGASWTVQTGCMYFSVLNDSLRTPNDSTIIFCVRRPPNLRTETFFSISGMTGATANLWGRIAFNSIYLRVEDFKYGLSWNRANNAVVNFLPSVLVVIMSYSTSASTGKTVINVNGRYTKSLDGTAGQGPEIPAHPLLIGCQRHFNTSFNASFRYYAVGKIGPLIMTKNILSQSQRGQVTNYLNNLLKLREVSF